MKASTLGAALGCALITASPLFSTPALATPETDRALEQVKALGKRWDGEVNVKTRDIYVPLHKVSRKDGVTITRDVSYGADPRNRLDVVEPIAKPSRPMPVVIYVHGGGLTGGDKDSPGTPAAGLVYTNVGTYFAHNGMLGIVATYRLLPQAKFPNGAEDVAGMVRWAKANAAAHGGDPDSIFVIGHSAGGTVVGGYLYYQAVQAADGPGIAGAVLMSPAVGGERTGPREKVARAYYGDDPKKWVENVPLGLFETYKGRKVPTLITVAELDPPEIEAPAADLIARICNRDQACPQFVNVRAHNHISSALSLNTGDETFGSVLLDFIRRTLAQRR